LPNVIKVSFAIKLVYQDDKMLIIMKDFTPFENYKRASKVYNHIWLIMIVVGFGVFIMQLISGNLKSNELQIANNFADFDCTQTADENLKQLPKEALKTDMDSTTVDIRKLVQTAQTKNSIPQITDPKFSKIEELEKCLQDSDEIIVLTINSQTKLYPKKTLAQHLVINDKLDDKPILVSYCVLCDSVKIYERTHQNEVLTFGTTGLLYKNNDLFYDNKNESLWTQYSGQAIAGEYSGSELSPIAFRIISFSKAKAEFSDAEILNFDTGFRRDYKDTSFEDFANSDQIISPITNNSDKLPPKTVIIGFEIESQKFAIAIEEIEDSEEFEILSKPLLVNIDSEEITLEYDGDPVDFTKGFWYVWFDFYPDTKILES